MVGAILTQNTNWRNVSAAIKRLRDARLLDPRRMLENARKIPHLIRPAGFYRTKAKYLKAFVNYYVKNYAGRENNISMRETQALREEFLSITGIGPETADSILLYALGKKTFVVDTYTRRILSRHKLVRVEDAYDKIQRVIQQNIPASVRIYNEFHALLVKTGKEYCKKNDPMCSTCPLGTMLP